jgi:uncharacterized protein (TIGR03437 family)
LKSGTSEPVDILGFFRVHRIMKFRFAAALLVCASSVYSADFATGQAARAEIGQYEFTQHYTVGSHQILSGIGGIAYDPLSQHLWVAEGNLLGITPVNNRVLGFSTQQIQRPGDDLSVATSPVGDTFCGLCGYVADTVEGQVDFDSIVPGRAQVAPSTTNGSMSSPTAVATDQTHLAVADTGNGRVLIWNHIPTSINNAPPDVVVGQTDFTSLQDPSSVSAKNLRAPQGVWIQDGKLFVADTGNNRVLIWNSIPTANGQPADVVLGQSNFSSNTAPDVNTTGTYTAAANLLWNPISVSVSPDGTHLFVSDYGYSRVLIWNSIPTQNQQPADIEVGQVDLNGGTSNDSSHLCASNGTDSSNNPTYPGRCEKTLSHPRFVLSDGTRLFIADTGNDRVLIYNQIPTANQAAADKVLGQVDFVSNAIAPNTSTITSFVSNIGSTDTIPNPVGLAYDGTNLYVSDPTDYRVLVFSPADIPVTGKQVLNNASEILKQEGVIALAGTPVANDTVTVTIQSTTYTYTVASGDTLDKVTTGVINAINANSGDPNATAAAGSAADTILLLSKNAGADLNSISYTATTSNTANVTAATAGSYLAGGFSGTLAPGTLFEIDAPSGYNLTDFTQAADVTKTLPTRLSASGTSSSVQVFVDGFPVPILKASPSQIVAQVPYTFEDGTTHLIDRDSLSVYARIVDKTGHVSITNAAPAAFTDANPGLFAVPSSTEPRAAVGAIHQAGNPSSTVSLTGTVTTGDSIAVTVGSNTYSYTVTSTDSLNSVAAALANKINAANDSNVTASAGAAGTLTLTARAAGSGGTGIAVSAAVTAATSGGTAGETATVSNATTCCSTSGTGAVTVYNPAQPNEVITFLATGLGNVEDASGNVIAVTAGVPYTGTQPNSVANLVNATVNGTDATVLNAGIANGETGVYEVKVQMPATLSGSLANVYIAQNAFIGNTVTIPVGSATAHSLQMWVDSPSQGQTANSGILTANGWAADPSGTVSSISVTLDGSQLGTPTRQSRADVCAAHPDAQDCIAGNPVGWVLSINTATLAQTSHTLTVTATSSDGDVQAMSVTFSIQGSMRMWIDAPQSNATVSGTLQVWGWATSRSATVPANSVTFRIDGGVVNSTTSFARPDVCAAQPDAYDCAHGNMNVGYTGTVDTTQLANGTHTVLVQAADANGVHRAASQTFTVNNSETGLQAYIDMPTAAGETVSGMLTAYGWAGSASSAVSQNAVFVDGTFWGYATPMTRPDVCAAHSDFVGCPSAVNIGWSVGIDTTVLANGTHQLQVVAHAGGATQTSSSSFNVQNWTTNSPIHLNVDAPANGASVNGTISPYGWVISDQAAITSVRVTVDGVTIPSTYGAVRGDVCANYPGRLGCPNVGWTSQLDTTTLSNGQHIFTFTAVTSNAQTYTVSNTFTVANSDNGIDMYIDTDSATPITSATQLYGWAGAASAPVTSITLSLDGQQIGQTTETVYRPDVCAAHPNDSGCPNGSLGWTFAFDPSAYTAGSHVLSATAVAGSVTRTISKNIIIGTPAGSPLAIFIDNPVASATYVGTVGLRGWASDGNGNLGKVTFAVDGIPVAINVTYGARTDVCAARGYAGSCANVGWSGFLDTTTLADGPHTLSVTASSGGQYTTSSQSFTVGNWTDQSPIQIYIDNPGSNGTPLAGLATLYGWASSPLGSVQSVLVTIDDLIIQTPANYGESRGDVCTSGYNCPNVGWSYTLDTTLLPDGPHTLSVTAQIAQPGELSTNTERTTISTTFTIQNYSN